MGLFSKIFGSPRRKEKMTLEVVAEFIPQYVFQGNHGKFMESFKKWRHPELGVMGGLLGERGGHEYRFSRKQWLEIYLFCYGCILSFFSHLEDISLERKDSFLSLLTKGFCKLLYERGFVEKNETQPNNKIIEKSIVYQHIIEKESKQSNEGMYTEYGILFGESVFGVQRESREEKIECIGLISNAPCIFQIVTRAAGFAYSSLARKYKLV